MDEGEYDRDIRGAAYAEEHQHARMWASICHLSGLAILIGIPFGNIIAPLVVWLIKREQSPFIDEQGKEAVNFQITITLAFFFLALIGALLLVVFVGAIFFAALIPLGIVWFVYTIIAAVKANNGVDYRYPFSIRFIE